MEVFKKCQIQSSLLEKKILESTMRWKTFASSQSSYQSVMRFGGKLLPAPVMTIEKRRRMQMYRKQAYIVEVKMKSRSREKEFLAKIQGALDEVRDFHIDTSESIEANIEDNSRLSSHSNNTNDSNLLHRSTQETESEKRIPEPKPLKKCMKAKSTTDISRMGKPPDIPHQNHEHFEGAKRIRRRYKSEGKSDCESLSVIQTKPCKSSGSPSRCKKSHSNSNLLTIPFEQYQQKVEELQQHGLSKPRQRYREERTRSNTLRTPSPQPPYQEVLLQADRPFSTPPNIATNPQLSNAVDEHQKELKDVSSFATVTTHAVSCKALKSLLETLDPSHDQPTHRWLTARMSDQEKNAEEDISLEDWFQNAPDSVKQKLALLLPKVSSNDVQQTDDCKVVNKSVDVQISPVHTCNLSDDTLRSTSPLPDEDANIHSLSLSEYIANPMNDDMPLLVIDKSPNASQNISQSFVRTESSNALEPSAESFETVVELQKSLRREKPIVPPLQLSPNEPPQSNTLEHSSDGNVPKTFAGDRKRSLSMQSYTVEEPSEALLNFTFSDKHGNSPDNKSVAISAEKPGSSGKTQTINHKLTNAQKISHAHDDHNTSDKKTDECEKTTKYKSRIPTPKATRPMLSKCKLDTPSPIVTQEQNQQSTSTKRQQGSKITPTPSSTPVNTARHRHLLKLLKRSELNEDRSLTPTPPSRVMTPTPPSRPKSEMGTRWSRSRSHSRNREAKTDPDDKRIHDVTSGLRGEDGGRPQDFPDISGSKSSRTTPSQPTSEKVGRRVRRSASCNIVRVKGEELILPNKNKDLQESPLKDYDGRDDRLARARKQLALLKAKFSTKAKQLLSHEDPSSRLPVSTTLHPTAVNVENSQVEFTGNPMRKFPTATVICVESPAVIDHTEVMDDGKENISVRQHSRNSNKPLTDRDETPITTVYSASNNYSIEVAADYSSLGNILSVSHKTNKLSPDKPDEQEVENSEKKRSPVASQETISGRRLYAVIKGHLCRKLLKCSKVRSIIKTIQDCQTLLPSIASFNNKSALYDVNFQQRLRQQMEAAKEDLHNIFFKLPSYQRITLIKQSEMVLARHRLRQIKAKKSKPEATRTTQNSEKRNNVNSANIMVRPRIHSVHTTTAPALRRHILQNGGMKPLVV